VWITSQFDRLTTFLIPFSFVRDVLRTPPFLLFSFFLKGVCPLFFSLPLFVLSFRFSRLSITLFARLHPRSPFLRSTGLLDFKLPFFSPTAPGPLYRGFPCLLGLGVFLSFIPKVFLRGKFSHPAFSLLFGTSLHVCFETVRISMD